MKITLVVLVLLFIGLSFASEQEYKFPDVTQDVEDEGSKFINDNLEDFVEKASDKYQLKPYFEELLDRLNTIQTMNTNMLTRSKELISQLPSKHDLDSVKSTQKELHSLASVQHYSLLVVRDWIYERRESVKDEVIKDLMYDVYNYCIRGFQYIRTGCDPSYVYRYFNSFSKMLTEDPDVFQKYHVDPVTQFVFISELTQRDEFVYWTEKAIEVTNKLIEETTKKSVPQRIKKLLIRRSNN